MNGDLRRTLRLGLCGGSKEAFIGKVHATAARMDGRAEIVAGALATTHDRCLEAAPDYDIAQDRAYPDYTSMFEGEATRDDGIDAVIIATPNDTHVKIARAALATGVHVISDKPLSNELSTAELLWKDQQAHPELVFGVTHNYTMNSMAIQGRELVRKGAIGQVHTVEARYYQGWLATRLETTGQKQAGWRTDPKRAGAGCWGDIGTHAFAQAISMTGLKPVSISAQLKTIVAGRKIDDWGSATIECEGGAVIQVRASQVHHGYLNDLDIAIYGTEGSIYWRQEEPNDLIVRRNDKPMEIHPRAGGNYMLPAAASLCRIPGGHPEAYLEGMANVYRGVFDEIVARKSGQTLSTPADYPRIELGVAGNVFIDRSQKSSKCGGSAVDMTHPCFDALTWKISS